jgi:hypothetical protein
MGATREAGGPGEVDAQEGRVGKNGQRQARHQTDEDALDPASVRALRWSYTPVGISCAAMSPTQRQLLSALVCAYLDRLPDDVASTERARIAGITPDELYFA